jgi:hypothetical protein
MARKTKDDDEMRSHYDFSGGVRGKYAARYAEGTNVVVLAPDVPGITSDSAEVSEDLRTKNRISDPMVSLKAVPKKRPGN